MEAWAKAQGISKVSMLADGNAEFTRQMGMLVDKSGLGFGPRSWRYSMLVRDGVIEKIFVEPEVEGDPYGVSDAETMLRHFDAEAQLPPDILLFTKPGCAHCARARRALEEVGLAYDELPADARQLRALSGDPTTPRVFINGELVGGADELANWIGRP
jgi:glutaredoxin